MNTNLDPESTNDHAPKTIATARELSGDELEKLGRQRPEAFRTAFAEIAFCFSLLASMFMAVREVGNSVIFHC